MIRAVAFDLDDTLAVTARDRETLLRNAADSADVPLTFDREDYLSAHREHSGTESRRPVFEALVGEPTDADALTTAYRDAIGEALTPVDGAEALLSDLRVRYRVGLLTDGPETTQLDKLGRLGWTDAFDAVVVTGAIDAPKPDPEAFAAIASELDVAPMETVYVGDDPGRDIAGAAAAGLVPIQVLHAGSEPHPDAAATVERADLASLPRLLDSLGDGADDA
ncbi:HAD family hydrolase [Natronomonas sp.]|uniref:HAD family hydrolase n=1 Tax=Natronomonas sp. TaxID=2184060 RepID=UPI0039895A6F